LFGDEQEFNEIKEKMQSYQGKVTELVSEIKELIKAGNGEVYVSEHQILLSTPSNFTWIA